MTTSELDYLIVDDNNIEIVYNFIFMGVLITNDGFIDKGLRRILAMVKCYMGSLKGIFNDRGIRLITNIIIDQTLVFPSILYEAEKWTINKVDWGETDAFDHKT